MVTGFPIKSVVQLSSNLVFSGDSGVLVRHNLYSHIMI